MSFYLGYLYLKIFLLVPSFLPTTFFKVFSSVCAYLETCVSSLFESCWGLGIHVYSTVFLFCFLLLLFILFYFILAYENGSPNMINFGHHKSLNFFFFFINKSRIFGSFPFNPAKTFLGLSHIFTHEISGHEIPLDLLK